jgi:Cu+-exporting ATPase
MTNKIFKVAGMHCTSCALMIESDLEDSGVKANCNYAKQILTVEFDETRMEEDAIKKIVKRLGYTLQ